MVNLRSTLERNPGITDNGALAISKLGGLAKLSICRFANEADYTGIGGQGVAAIASSLKKLEYLNICNFRPIQALSKWKWNK